MIRPFGRAHPTTARHRKPRGAGRGADRLYRRGHPRQPRHAPSVRWSKPPLADRLWFGSRDGRVAGPYEGDLDSYRALLLKGEEKPVQNPRKEEKKRRVYTHDEIKELRAELRRCEARVAKIEEMRGKLATRLADPALYGDGRGGELATWQAKYGRGDGRPRPRRGALGRRRREAGTRRGGLTPPLSPGQCDGHGPPVRTRRRCRAASTGTTASRPSTNTPRTASAGLGHDLHRAARDVGGRRHHAVAREPPTLIVDVERDDHLPLRGQVLQHDLDAARPVRQPAGPPQALSRPARGAGSRVPAPPYSVSMTTDPAEGPKSIRSRPLSGGAGAAMAHRDPILRVLVEDHDAQRHRLGPRRRLG